MSEPRDALKPIRLILYLATVFYGLVNIVMQEQNLVMASKAPAALEASAAIVGTIQLLAAILGLILELSGVKKVRRAIQLIFLALSLSFLYESVLVLLLSGGNPFSWAPLIVYSVICSVIYLAEG